MISIIIGNIIALIALGITALVQCNGKQNKESEIFSLQNKQTELEKQVKSLKNKNTELTNTNNSMSNIIQNVSKNSPFIVNDFSVKSNKESYGCSRISSYSNDISCRIRGFSLTTQNITITEKCGALSCNIKKAWVTLKGCPGGRHDTSLHSL